MRASEHPYFRYDLPVIAHRGGAMMPVNRGVENTVGAFRAAVATGVRHLETDVHATSDGRLVAFHDPDLRRLTGLPDRIADLTWSQVRTIGLGSEAIPLLVDVLDEFPEHCFNIDIKAEGAVEPLSRLVRRHRGLHARVCVASFGEDRLRRFRRLAPGTATAMSPKEVAVAAWAPWTRPVSRWLQHSPGMAAQVPLHHRVAGISVPVLGDRLLRACRHTGKHVHAWTIDDPDVAMGLVDKGVDALISDRPDILTQVLTQ